MSEHYLTTEQKRPGFWKRALSLYVDGFRNMSRTSRTLWVIILIKLFIMFAVLRLFFFPNIVKHQGDKAKQVEYVVNELTKDEYKDGEIPLWYDQNRPQKEKQQ